MNDVERANMVMDLNRELKEAFPDMEVTFRHSDIRPLFSKQDRYDYRSNVFRYEDHKAIDDFVVEFFKRKERIVFGVRTEIWNGDFALHGFSLLGERKD